MTRSRRIATGSKPGAAVAPAGPGGAPIDDYLGRMVKYIPAEIVTVYLTCINIWNSNLGKTVLFFVGVVLTFVYFLTTTWDGTKGPLWRQIVLATVAFVVWCLALGNPLPLWIPQYNLAVASVILVVVTCVFGWVKPPLGA